MNTRTPFYCLGDGDGVQERLADRGIPFSEAWGAYNGFEEKSLIVFFQPLASDFESNLLEVAGECGEESIFYCDSAGLCYFIFTDGTISRLGKIKVSKSRPDGDWTAYKGFYFYA